MAVTPVLARQPCVRSTLKPPRIPVLPSLGVTWQEGRLAKSPEGTLGLSVRAIPRLSELEGALRNDPSQPPPSTRG